MIICLLDASIIITNSLRSNSVIIMDYAVRTSPSTSSNSCRKLMTGYLFIAVYTDVNGYSGEWLYYYLTFFINFICFLLFQQCFHHAHICLLHSPISQHLSTSSQNNFHRNPIFLYYFTYLLHFILPVHGSSFTFYTFHISNMYILLIIMHSIFLHFSFFNDAYSKKQLLVYGHGAAIYPELSSDNFSLFLLPGTFPQQFPYCCIHLQPDG